MSVWDDTSGEIYTFRYHDADRNITYTTEKNNDYWPDVLNKFIDFLSSVYGYDIRDKVTIDSPNKQLSLDFGDE